MNPINYATLKQSIKLKELNFPQDKTDCVWITRFVGNKNMWQLAPRENVILQIEQGREWFAAPNAQEIELSIFNGGLDATNYHDTFMLVARRRPDKFSYGAVHHAQARADAKIWELENSK